MRRHETAADFIASNPHNSRRTPSNKDRLSEVGLPTHGATETRAQVVGEQPVHSNSMGGQDSGCRTVQTHNENLVRRATWQGACSLPRCRCAPTPCRSSARRLCIPHPFFQVGPTTPPPPARDAMRVESTRAPRCRHSAALIQEEFAGYGQCHSVTLGRIADIVILYDDSHSPLSGSEHCNAATAAASSPRPPRITLPIPTVRRTFTPVRKGQTPPLDRVSAAVVPRANIGGWDAPIDMLSRCGLTNATVQ